MNIQRHLWPKCSAYEQWRASSAASISLPLHVDTQTDKNKIKKINHNKITLAKIPEIWLLHVPAKVIFVSKEWVVVGGGRAGDGCCHVLAGCCCLAKVRGRWRRKCSAAQRTTAGGTQWTLLLPTTLHRTHWPLMGQRGSETAHVASLVPPNKNKA